jgi:sphingomyelin phosphodiesterase acid-like 3
MTRWSPFLCSFILISLFSMFGCSGVSSGTTPPVTPPTPASVYHIVTVSDLHFNPLYDPSLFPQLLSSLPTPGTASHWDPSPWQTIFQSSNMKTPSTAGTDTNYPLLLLAMESIEQNVQANPSPVVLLTGDLLGHNIETNYCTIYLKSENSPVNNTTLAQCIATQSTTIQNFIDSTFTFVATQIQTAVSSAPVIYAPGNIDTYYQDLAPNFTACIPQSNVNLCDLGPDSTFLLDNEATVWNQFLEGKADASFTTTFPSGGYYFAQSLGSKLRILALNSNSFVENSPTYTTAADELTWLGQQLSSAQASGQKVWILMHVPPGANSQSIAQVAAVPGDVDANDAFMMWDPSLQSTFINTLQAYPGVVTLMLAGHTHMDEYRILDSNGDVLEQLPGISPCFGNNPAYKVVTISQSTFTPTDYQSFDYNLALLPPASQFSPLYQFSSTYGLTGNLGDSLQQLYPEFATNQNQQKTYTLMYTSGSESLNPVTLTPWNPINDVNWPIFACTIDDMDQSDYVTCVNSY